MTATVRVLVALDVPAEQATDRLDLASSVHARLADEAGYLIDGMPVMPTQVVVTIVDDAEPLTEDGLRGAYLVGIEGAADWTPTTPSGGGHP